MAVSQTNFSLMESNFKWRNKKGNDYSPFDKRGYYSKITLEVNIPANISGDYFMSFINNNNTNYRIMSHDQSSDKLIYYISKSTNVNQYLTSWPNITNDEGTILFSLDGTNSSVFRTQIYIWIDPGQIVNPGDYVEVIPIKIYKGSYNSESMPSEIKTLNVRISATVSDEAQISIGNDSFSSISDFKVSFETLQEGEVIAYKAYVKSAKSYTLKIYSENKSKLRNENEKVKTVIPYKMYVDDTELQYFDGNEIEMGIEKTSNNEVTEHQIKLILGPSSHAFKGAYFDKISLRATSN